ncbi:MAG TPA: bifunctional riboflavin kinase/FAD synthetase [Candidatus Paenalcaligenes intestinipullorum]|uniref:Riboflavin biosynthesis protein n=1 Tax=Candidatus Paenalcaligenes intestinipullorum TaxID=2838718 RepID=A0A9D2RJF2_9BURK|nr:bifunctional riboflavin kinase/FAD synthetase [Candidatus Paenalcaligenes intestinipullorum]
MPTALTIYRTLPRFNCTQPSAVTIGNFDGVHRGHQAILAPVKKAADQYGLLPSVVTFTPHPRAFFAEKGHRPELIPTQISNLRDKFTLLHEYGMQQIVLAKFNHALATLPAEQFIQQLLLKGLNTKWLLVGEDFRFGFQRKGDLDLLAQYAQRYDFTLHTIEDIQDAGGQRISSSEVRTALAVGNLERSQALLGHPYRLTGHVIHGQKLGRTIGFPTLNLRAPAFCAARSGIYIVRVLGLSDQPLPGVASLGVRPTVTDNGALLLEVHLLDRNVDAYGKLVRVEFLHFVRDEEKFPNIETMTAAINSDACRAREYFAINGL